MQVKPINGSNKYFITDSGEVYNRRGRRLKQHINSKTGYAQLGIYYKGKQRSVRVHRLVAEAFVPNPNPEQLKEVNHIDGNKQNNRAENLEWTNKSGNALHAYQTGLKKTVPVSAYTKAGRFVASFSSVSEAMAFVGVPYNAGISNCLRGKTATAHGYVWRRT